MNDGTAPHQDPLAPPAEDTLVAPGLAFFARLTVQVGPPLEVGRTDAGLRRLIPILGGTVEGPGVAGRILPGGADFQRVRDDHVAELDARYVLQLDDGTAIYVVNRALRSASAAATARLVRGEPVDPTEVYFRCAPSFEVAEGPWRWLMRSLFIGTGVRRPDRVEIAVYRVC
jgi:hypothetical protein